MVVGLLLAVPASSSAAHWLPINERGVIQCVNHERAKVGHAPLQANPALKAAARRHARNMLRFHFFGHDDPWGRGPAERVALHDPGHSLDFIGENIAWGYQTAAEACRNWMASPGHRFNILDPDYTQTGVGAIRGGRYSIFWVEDFGRLAPQPWSGDDRPPE
ncbi:MAG: hypothetical protein QOJ97_222 [Solirubrobacteraceae bacterium]|nr:hypothetical protein [Solirubrobacteraceae bacterium]